MFQKNRIFTLFFALCVGAWLPFGGVSSAQVPEITKADKEQRRIQEQEAREKAKKAKQDQEKLAKEKQSQAVTADAIVETAIFAYGGRAGMSQIRKTELERGKITRFQPNGKTEEITYEKRIARGESIGKDRLRFDQKSPTFDFALVLNQNKIFGIVNETVFQPRKDINSQFEAQLWLGLEALLRYKENGATLKIVGKDKQMGVEYHIIEMTDTAGHTARYNISTKTYRVLSVEYSQAPGEGIAPVRYLRKFYDYRIAQGTLVPFRSVLFENDRQIEEINVLTVTYGIKVDDALFGDSPKS